MRRPPILLAALAWVAFAILAVLVKPGPVLFDEGLLITFASWRGESLDHVVVGITHLGGYVVQILLGVGLGGVLLVRARPFGLFVATSLLGSFVTNEGLKRLFGRPRPSLVDRITDPYGLSFPSGHSQATMAFCLTLVLVAQHHPAVGPRGRRLAWPDGVVRPPSELGMTVGSPASRTETTELVVPRSIPTALGMCDCLREIAKT